MYISIVSRSYFFFFNQQTAYEMRISDWSSDVCSSDLQHRRNLAELPLRHRHRDDDRDHEGDRALDRRGRRGERAFTARREFVGEEEDEQRPEIDHEIEPAMLRRRRCRDRLGASGKHVAHLIFPAMMPAISSASNGRRSPKVSPMPIA